MPTPEPWCIGRKARVFAPRALDQLDRLVQPEWTSELEAASEELRHHRAKGEAELGAPSSRQPPPAATSQNGR